MLLGLGADMMIINEFGDTSAHHGMVYESRDCLKAFIDAGFNLGTRGEIIEQFPTKQQLIAQRC